jgi:hypothetical protein
MEYGNERKFGLDVADNERRTEAMNLQSLICQLGAELQEMRITTRETLALARVSRKLT